jgi:hypothetical protein
MIAKKSVQSCLHDFVPHVPSRAVIVFTTPVADAQL